MRPQFISSNPFMLFMLFAVLGLFTACTEEEPTLSERLDGEWDVESFTVDGVEFMQTTVTSFELEFDDEGEDQGDTKWTIIFFDGSTQVIEGEFEINDGGKELRLSDNTGYNDFDMEMSGEDLELTGIIAGERWEIEAEK